jgi:hypothetical protein
MMLLGEFGVSVIAENNFYIEVPQKFNCRDAVLGATRSNMSILRGVATT